MEGEIRRNVGSKWHVLILLLMEYGHGEISPILIGADKRRLNPSFNGIWSWSEDSSGSRGCLSKS